MVKDMNLKQPSPHNAEQNGKFMFPDHQTSAGGHSGNGQAYLELQEDPD
jgi:hypothetical protein